MLKVQGHQCKVRPQSFHCLKQESRVRSTVETAELRSEQSFAIHQAFAEEEKLVKEGRERVDRECRERNKGRERTKATKAAIGLKLKEGRIGRGKRMEIP